MTFSKVEYILITSMKPRTLTEYEISRNTLIPDAVEYTNHRVGKTPEVSPLSRIKWSNRWNRVFFARMNKLWLKHATVSAKQKPGRISLNGNKSGDTALTEAPGSHMRKESQKQPND